MNNSIEWDIIENKNKDKDKDIKYLLEKVNILETQNSNLLSKVERVECQNSDLNHKIDFCTEKINNLEKMIKLFLRDNNEILSIDEDNNDDKKIVKNMTVDFNFPPYDLSNNYINRMTNRLWRNSPYITTPNFLFTNLNKN